MPAGGRIHPDLAALAYPIAKLTPLDGNPNKGDVEAVMRSFRTFGQRKPIVARRRPDGVEEVTAGNHGLEAAKRLGWTEIAVVWSDDDDVTAKAWALADNHTAQLATTDPEALAAMLSDVSVSTELLAATAYTEADLAKLVPGGADDQTDELGTGVYAVVIPCRDEAEQLELVHRFMEEGLVCRAVVS
jgi:ParB family chromosome partitioning protein